MDLLTWMLIYLLIGVCVTIIRLKSVASLIDEKLKEMKEEAVNANFKCPDMMVEICLYVAQLLTVIAWPMTVMNMLKRL